MIVTPTEDDNLVTKTKTKTENSVQKEMRKESKRCFTSNEISDLCTILLKLADKGLINVNGKVIKPDGKVIKGSNIVQILIHAIKPENYVEGYEYLPTILREAEINDIPNKLILIDNKETELRRTHEEEIINDQSEGFDTVDQSPVEKDTVSVDDSVAKRQKQNPRIRKKRNWLFP